MIVLKLLFVIIYIHTSYQLNNGLSLTPQMGWNHFRCHINQKLIEKTADLMVSTGLAAVGFEFVEIYTKRCGILKHDNCNTDGTTPYVRYPLMRDALNATGRQIFYSICGWVVDQPARWATDDIQDNWKSMFNNIDACSNKTPLIIGCDISDMIAATLATLTNSEVAFAWSQSLNRSTIVGLTNCSSSSSNIQPKRLQWKYNPEDGSIRSVPDGRCLSIENCDTTDGANIVVADCHINDSQAKCQGKIDNGSSIQLINQLFPK
ncbi:hypothetical protein I4U23_005818 [Adineta vaga]|nr:hypothetical protein I4U23_005818 [Adineta vaga]